MADYTRDLFLLEAAKWDSKAGMFSDKNVLQGFDTSLNILGKTFMNLRVPKMHLGFLVLETVAGHLSKFNRAERLFVAGKIYHRFALLLINF